MQGLNKEWQVEAQGVVYEATLEELKQWISEFAVLPTDRVRRAGLRWLPVDKVPDLRDFIDTLEPDRLATGDAVADGALLPEPEAILSDDNSRSIDPEQQEIDPNACMFHQDEEIAFVCDICENSFCKNCPKSYGTVVKLCPVCDSLCRSVDDLTRKQRPLGSVNKPYTPIEEVVPSVGFARKGASLLTRPITLTINKLRVIFGAKTSHVDECR
ncbi:MAG TPA: hypothetical protein VJL58_05690 [Pyrinomonadaceae bacterium]|nr:hypothetical protein [Pyrinomonadaceae bacterium]